jgi:hypothetical protein
VADLWNSFFKLTRVKQKLSSSHHPQTDGSSEHSNKTVIQCIRFHVECHQQSWARALPTIRFRMMNSINASTGLSGFQVCIGCSPCVLPPLVPSLPKVDNLRKDIAKALRETVDKIHDLESQAKDTLLVAKVSQAHFVNAHRSTADTFKVGNKVLLSMTHREKSTRMAIKLVLPSSSASLTVPTPLLQPTLRPPPTHWNSQMTHLCLPHNRPN